MREQRGGEVAGEPVAARPTNADASRGERLELSQCRPHSSRMSFKNPFVVAQESRDGNGFRRRESEVIENPAIGRVLAIVCPRRVQPLRQSLAGSRMLILAQPEKIIRADFAGQSETLRAKSHPFPGHTLTLIVVVPDAEVFFKVFPRVRQVVLRLGRDHTANFTRWETARCVSDTSF